MAKRFIITSVLIFLVLFGAFATTYTPVVDSSSTYTPTKIINGDFSAEPWMEYEINGTRYSITYTPPYQASYGNVAGQQLVTYPNGTDKGWNTTENMVWYSTGLTLNKATLFDWSTTIGYKYNNPVYYNLDSKGDANPYLEMNLWNNACLYQDLTTYPGDVIRWTLKHGYRKDNGDKDGIQEMDVQVGAPLRDISGNIIYPTGINNNNINNPDNIKRNIEPNSNATYTKDGVTNGSLNLGSANLNELTNLYLTSTPATFNQDTYWKTSKGVYIIPEGQTVTRFAFTSLKAAIGGGNELDDITFSTLIGNLSAVQNANKSITISGYWGILMQIKNLI